LKGKEVLIVGGGLAGSEACWQVVKAGGTAVLFEMKPKKFSPAHRSEYLAELVCSNSLRANSLDHASGLLKEEMRRLGSLILQIADKTAVPAGVALAVDREAFSIEVTRHLLESGATIIREEVKEIPSQRPLVVSTGPLPSESMAHAIEKLAGRQCFYFYDAIAPIVDGDSIDYEIAFWASRYGRGGDDYLNCPLDEATYHSFVREVLHGQKVPLRDFEDIPPFEGCLPIEDLAKRGQETLAYGPMKPVGLTDPRTGKQPYAVVQLRREDLSASLFNLVGFQTKLTWDEQKRIFRMIPGLERAEFHRYGSLHRNAFINAPLLLDPTLQFRRGDPYLFFAGQVTGVEGYIESTATGCLAGINAGRILHGLNPVVPPPTTAIGALVQYVVNADPTHFQPMNINFGLFPPLREQGGSRGLRRRKIVERALHDLEAWKKTMHLGEAA
jgi:methylenetetrahydrofolate--tRNA-(uracil-5-)-methyltransferase